MNHDVNVLSDFYKTKINPSFILKESFSDLYKTNAIIDLQEWYDYDLQCLNELLVQEGLGDALKSVGQKIGGAVKGAGDFAMKKLATALGKILKMAMPSEEEAQKLEQEVQKLQSDKNYLQQQAAAGQKLLGTGGNEASEEVYESTKEFLLSTVFSEANLRDLFKQSLLTEAKAGRPKGKSNKSSKNVPVSAGGFQKNSVRALDTHINDLVKIISGMKQGQKKLALNRIARTLGKQTKLEFPQPFPRAQKQDGQPQANNQLAFQAANQMATQDKGQLATQNQLATQSGNKFDVETGQPQEQLGQGEQQPQLGNGRQSRFDKENAIDADYREVGDEQQPEQTKGLFQKIMGYVKSHPRLTSAVAIALIAAVTAASGGTLLPLVIGGLSTGTVKAGMTAYQTNKEGGKVDWSKTVDAAFTGAAKGVGASAAGEAIGAIGKQFIGNTPTTDSAGIEAPDNPQPDYTEHDGGLGAKDAAEAQADVETNTAQYPTQVDDAAFQKYNASAFNPKSPLDQAKKALMQKLSDNNSGNIPASQYNDLANKASALVKKGIKPNDVVRQLMGESYTAKYLNYF